MGEQTYLSIDKVFERLEFKEKEVKESLENFRDEHCDMCFHYKDIANMVENTNENATRKELIKLIDDIFDISIQHTSYWIEE